MQPGAMAHACNMSYSGSGDQEDHEFQVSPRKISETLLEQNTK
jgi:hypothetical protein